MFEALLLAAALSADLPDAAALLDSADAPRRALLHSVVRLRATVQPEDAPAQTGEFDLYLGGEDEQLVVFRDKKNKGRKFLLRGDKSWLIVPGSKNPIAITANQRMLGASSFADLARVRLAQDYTGSLRPGMEPCGLPAQPCRVVEITAKAKAAPYATGMLWIDTAGLVQRAVYHLASGKAAKEIVYRYRGDNGRTMPAGLTLRDLLLPDQTGKTTLEYLDVRPAEHPADWFDPESQIKR
jgi:hypothetical protein